MARAVHGLHAVLAHARVLVVALVDLEEVHVLFVETVVARGLPHVRVVDVRGDDLLVAALVEVAAQPLLHGADDARALRQIERQAHARHGIHHVDAQFAAELAVVALLGFLQVVQMLVELLLLEERGAVDALQHLAVAVALPIRARHLHELERADLARGGHVRAAAQVHEIAVAANDDLLVGGKLADMLQFEALVGEDGLGLVARNHLSHERLVAFDDLGHLGLDGLEVLRSDGARQLEVVEEAVFGLRSERNLRAGEQKLHGLGHDVGGRMAHDAERLGAFRGDDLHGRTVFHGSVQVGERAVDLAAERGLRQASADGGGHVGHGGAVGEFLLRAVGKYDVHTGSFLCAGRAQSACTAPFGRRAIPQPKEASDNT